MNNNQESEQPKISKGCVITAFNSPYNNYTDMAVKAADRVTKFLDIPVCIITDEFFETDHQLIIIDKPPNNKRPHPLGNKVIDWFNLVRTHVYDLSPFDRTLIIDGDLFLNTSNLLPHLNCNSNFLIAKSLYDLIYKKVYYGSFSSSNLPLYWATVIIFNKSDEAKNIFEMAKLVEKNYGYYSTLYNFPYAPIRNDFIFSIAIHLMGGYGLKNYEIKNYPLIQCNCDVTYLNFDGNTLVYEYEQTGKIYKNKISDIDLHLMNKDQL